MARGSTFARSVVLTLAVACGPALDQEASSHADATEDRAVSAASLAAGYDHTCVVARREVRCWGNSTSIQGVAASERPRQLVAGASHACVLDGTSVKCWGESRHGQTATPTTLVNPRQISAGFYFTCALHDGGATCWGNDDYKQLTAPALRNPRQVAAGGNFVCALDDAGVKCWGDAYYGQLAVPALRNPTELSAGSNHVCALDADGVKCWGRAAEGQTKVPALRSPRQVRAGGLYTCALDDEGVKCWGNAAAGQTTPPRLRQPRQLSAGYSHACAIDEDGVKCWGSNASGKTVVPADLDLSGHHACVATSSGLRCVGDNDRGQLGAGTDADRPIAIARAAVVNLGTAFGAPSKVALGRNYGCVLAASGAVKCWGSNEAGQLGLADERDRGARAIDMGDSLPALRLGEVAATMVDVGERHACAVTAGDALYCWGAGAQGRLGTESTDDVGATSGPKRVRLKAGLKLRQLALGRSHSCLATADGAVYCFGDNESGQLGVGHEGPVGDRPDSMGEAMQPVVLGDGFVTKSIAAGERHACALSRDGRVKCWGANERGQLGLGDQRGRGLQASDMGDALPAVDLGRGQVVSELACGARHCCATTVQGTMKCWGDNAQGELGLGDVVPRGTQAASMGDELPWVMLPARERVLAMLLTGERTCARTESGLRCWGRNRSGELGYGDREPRGGTSTTVPKLLAPLGI